VEINKQVKAHPNS